MRPDRGHQGASFLAIASGMTGRFAPFSTRLLPQDESIYSHAETPIGVSDDLPKPDESLWESAMPTPRPARRSES
jgi:hypothetical protein